jgi:hypothetical protein
MEAIRVFAAVILLHGLASAEDAVDGMIAWVGELTADGSGVGVIRWSARE